MAKAPSTQLEVSQSFFQGPIPPPEVLQKFGEVDPSFPERIMRMAEGQAAHRREEERGQRWMDAILRAGGLACAFASVVGVLVLAWYAFQQNHAVEAAGMVGALVAGMVAAFIKGTGVQGKSRE